MSHEPFIDQFVPSETVGVKVFVFSGELTWNVPTLRNSKVVFVYGE